MDMNNADKPAMPNYHPDGVEYGSPGLTKREYFAAMAMQGLMTKQGVNREMIVQMAISHADAMLKELEVSSETSPRGVEE